MKSELKLKFLLLLFFLLNEIVTLSGMEAVEEARELEEMKGEPKHNQKP